jgi:hypothetical protein
MKYARHGHSCCAMGETFIIVTGSRKDISKAHLRTEVYNTELNTWTELAMFNHGRHYHSSCQFNKEFVYIFCGISNESKKYLNSIERLPFNPYDVSSTATRRWELLNI